MASRRSAYGGFQWARPSSRRDEFHYYDDDPRTTTGTMAPTPRYYRDLSGQKVHLAHEVEEPNDTKSVRSSSSSRPRPPPSEAGSRSSQSYYDDDIRSMKSSSSFRPRPPPSEVGSRSSRSSYAAPDSPRAHIARMQSKSPRSSRSNAFSFDGFEEALEEVDIPRSSRSHRHHHRSFSPSTSYYDDEYDDYPSSYRSSSRSHRYSRTPMESSLVSYSSRNRHRPFRSYEYVYMDMHKPSAVRCVHIQDYPVYEKPKSRRALKASCCSPDCFCGCSPENPCM